MYNLQQFLSIDNQTERAAEEICRFGAEQHPIEKDFKIAHDWRDAGVNRQIEGDRLAVGGEKELRSCNCIVDAVVNIKTCEVWISKIQVGTVHPVLD